MRHKCCVACQVELIPQQNDVGVLYVNADGTPDSLWSADLWRCPSCGWQGLLGFGIKPIAEAWQGETFARAVQSYALWLHKVWLTPQARDEAEWNAAEKVNAG